jgi:hypothetical protein
MVTRRKLILSGAAGLLAATLPRASLAAPDDPVGIVTAIYTRAAKGKGDVAACLCSRTRRQRQSICRNH